MSTQGERTQIAVLQNDMKQVKSDISEMKSDIKIIKEGLDGKYASKWVQQVVGGLIAVILLAVITALLALIIIPASKKNADGSTPTSSTPASANANSTATADGTKAADSQPSGGLLDNLPLIGH